MPGATVSFQDASNAAAWIMDLRVPDSERTGQNLAEAVRHVAQSPDDNLVFPSPLDTSVIQIIPKDSVLLEAYKRFRLSDAYLQNSRSRAIQGMDAFFNTHDMKELKHNWGRYPEQTRMEILKKFHACIAQAYGISPATLVTQAVDPVHSGFLEFGHYNRVLDQITLNVHPNAFGDDPEKLFHTLLHETIHRKQDAFIEDPQKAEALYQNFQAEMNMLWANILDGAYLISSRVGLSAYVENPHEEEAWIVSNAFLERIGRRPVDVGFLQPQPSRQN
jgi:hypothetical protein